MKTFEEFFSNIQESALVDHAKALRERARKQKHKSYAQTYLKDAESAEDIHAHEARGDHHIAASKVDHLDTFARDEIWDKLHPKTKEHSRYEDS